MILTEPYPLYRLVTWFERFFVNSDIFIPKLIMFGIALSIVSLIFAFYRRYSRQNAELIERVLIIFCFLGVLIMLAFYFDLQLF